MRRVALAIFGTVAGLVGLLSFKTHAPTAALPAAAVSTVDPGTDTGANGTAPAANGTAPSSAPTATGTSSSPSSTSKPSSSASTKSATKPVSKTVTGDSADTRWGPVQVKITVTNGKVTSATAVDYPQNNGRDQEINATAIPTLQQETIGVSTANIDIVSGATYTSQGYQQSLQSALDKAGL